MRLFRSSFLSKRSNSLFSNIPLRFIWNKSTHINPSGINYDKVSEAEGTVKYSDYENLVKGTEGPLKSGDPHTDRMIHNQKVDFNSEKQDLSYQADLDRKRGQLPDDQVSGNYFASASTSSIDNYAKNVQGTSLYDSFKSKENRDAFDKSHGYDKDDKIVEVETSRGSLSNEPYSKNLSEGKLSMATAKKGISENDAKPTLDTQQGSNLDVKSNPENKKAETHQRVNDKNSKI